MKVIKSRNSKKNIHYIGKKGQKDKQMWTEYYIKNQRWSNTNLSIKNGSELG